MISWLWNIIKYPFCRHKWGWTPKMTEGLPTLGIPDRIAYEDGKCSKCHAIGLKAPGIKGISTYAPFKQRPREKS